MAQFKGLSVNVLIHKSWGDCSNGGISSRNNSLILVDCEGPFEGDERNTVRLVKKDSYMYVEPIEQPKGMVGPMFGGNFVYSSDSRFSVVSKYPIPIHDRFETQQEYDTLSR